MRLLIVTGLSGAGKSTALRALEDVDFFCVDNLPLPQVERCVELVESQRPDAKLALVIDARQGDFLGGYRAIIAALRARAPRPRGHGEAPSVEVLFLDSPDDVLLRRFSETRRRHPLAGDDLKAGIEKERRMLQPLREDAGAIVDTASLNVHQLKGIIQERYGRSDAALSVTLLSFGFKHGYPAEADEVFDVRFLPNPYFVEGLSGSTGLDPEVARYVLENDDAHQLLARMDELLAFSLPRFEREGKAYLTIAVGCTGGRHRSVAVVEELARRLGGSWRVVVRHRDLGRGARP